MNVNILSDFWTYMASLQSAPFLVGGVLLLCVAIYIVTRPLRD